MPVFVEVFIEPIRDNPVAQVAVMAVLLLTLLDVVFGIAKALLQHDFQSTKMRQGIGHKCASLGFMLVGVIVDGAVLGGVDLGFSAPVLTTICIYLCLMELASLMETFAAMNPELAGSPVFKLLESSHVIDTSNEETRSALDELGDKPGQEVLEDETDEEGR